MITIVILIASILIQFIAAFLALRLVWVTKKTPAWVIIALAICLMAVRRCIAFYQLVFGEVAHPLRPNRGTGGAGDLNINAGRHSTDSSSFSFHQKF